MSYTRHDWENGQIISESLLNHMEEGIEENGRSIENINEKIKNIPDVSSFQSNLTTIGSSVTELASSLTTMQNNIYDNTEKIRTNENKIRTNEGKIKTNEDEIKKIKENEIKKINEDIKKVDEKVDAIDTTVSKEDVTSALGYTPLKSSDLSNINGAIEGFSSSNKIKDAIENSIKIKIVDDVPDELSIEEKTIYLVPNEDKYDKYISYKNDDDTLGISEFGGSNTEVIEDKTPEEILTPDKDIDYIFKSGNGYIYYKYINDEWHMIAGSKSEILDELPDTGDELTDYYIKVSDDKYLHYRYVNGSFVQIGSDAYSKTEIDTKLDTIDANIEALQTEQGKITTTLSSVSSKAESNKIAIENMPKVEEYNISYSPNDGRFVFYTGNEEANIEDISEDVIKSSFTIVGGSGGTSSSSIMSIKSITENPYYVLSEEQAIISFEFSDKDADGDDVAATARIVVDGNTVKEGIQLIQGVNNIDVTNYLSVGTQKVRIYCIDEYSSRYKEWTVRSVQVGLTSSYNERTANVAGRAVVIPYVATGAGVSKTIHFVVDGEEIGTAVETSSGIPSSYSIPAYEHGSHTLKMYATAIVGGTEKVTNSIYKNIIWYDEKNEKPIISSSYNFEYYGNITSRHYDTFEIPYVVYDSKSSTPLFEIWVDGKKIDSGKLNSVSNTYNYYGATTGLHEINIYVGTVNRTSEEENSINEETSRYDVLNIKIDVTELDINVDPIMSNLEFDFNPIGKSNTSDEIIGPQAEKWTYGDYHMTVSDNFDWSNGGYRTDENGEMYFSIKAGTRAYFDYKMFDSDIVASKFIEKATERGTEMKLVYMTENVQDKDAVWFTNADEESRGIQLSVHEGWLKTNNAGKVSDDEDVAITNTYLYMPYSEEDIIELDINIDARPDEESKSKIASIMSYEDGVPSKAYIYNDTDVLYQDDAKIITIGSDLCDVRIYRFKIYSQSLDTTQIMKNFIADSRNTTEMLSRYDRNSIYYNKDNDVFTPYATEGKLDPEKFAEKVPNIKVLMLDTDHFTTSKKTFVKATLRCIHSPGGDVYSGDRIEDNWFFENGWHSGQGTTSDNYGNSSRNVDFLFNCDGVHKPSDKVSAESNYISKLTKGYKTEDAIVSYVSDWKGEEGKVALTRTSVPNNFFNLKVNVASSENANNALLQKRYNDFLPYISPAKARDEKIKNDMEFVPAVLFLKENNPDLSTHNEFNDTEWHFYSLGNIGDSKKTDYTRAYDPSDMNEFVIEISDNTKNNATFQTGVYIENGIRKIEPLNYNPDTDGIHSYVYPITNAEWNDNNNRKNMLYNEAFDGDHSFEPRYACLGDFRDGKLVNDTTGKANEQLLINNEIWRAFYRWVITSTDQEFVKELDEWCVRSAVEFFYAFTHYFTMMDNRAKNTFWHFAKTGTHRKASKPVKELLPIYDELVGDEYVRTSDTTIKAGKNYYTEYAFDLWDYDNDTAIGINNNGELVFPYGKEDTDYTIEGDPNSGYIFNGATSVFWCRLRDLLSNEIRTTFNATVDSSCFNATNIINEFDKYQNCYPEEVWRLDIQRKYLRTFTGDSIDNSIPKKDTQYLRDMMQGRKKYQRRQWLRDQEIYFGTMNLMNSVVGDNNRITFRCFTPTGSVAVKPNYTLNITPFSDMYVSVMFGNGNTEQVRAKGGQSYEIKCPLAKMDDTQVTIYGANRIKELNDLSACYIAANNFSMAKKLTKLVLGNTTPGYSNSKLTSLTLGDNELLQELDIRNCNNLTGGIDLSDCINLLKLYAEGTKLTAVTFAQNGKIQIAHLPDTINTLIARNLYSLTEFQATLDNLNFLTLENGLADRDDRQITLDTIDTLRQLYLYNIKWELQDTQILNLISNLTYSLVTGEVKLLPGSTYRLREINKFNQLWPDLTIDYSEATEMPQNKVTFVNYDDSVLYETYVDRGSYILSSVGDPIEKGYISIPTKESDANYDYTFEKWSDNIDSVITGSDITIKAEFTREIRKYKVTWYSKVGEPLKTLTDVNYGSDVSYGDEIPTRSFNDDNSNQYNIFAGWDRSTGYITGNTDVYAIWNSSYVVPEPADKESENYFEKYSFAELNSILKNSPIDATEKATYFNNYFYEGAEKSFYLGNDFTFTNTAYNKNKNGLIEEIEIVPVDSPVKITTSAEAKAFNESLEEIKLFDLPSFTIAVDFKVLQAKLGNTILNCSETVESGGTTTMRGLNIAANSGQSTGDIDVSWCGGKGSFGNNSYRDIVVIRKPENDPDNKIYVYWSNGASNRKSDASFTLTGGKQDISASNFEEINKNLLLEIGGKKEYDSIRDTYVYTSVGNLKIYWCKLWKGDLGDTVSSQIASWYREKVSFKCTLDRRMTTNGITPVNMSLISNGLLGYRQCSANGTWKNSDLNNLLNNKLYNSIPIQLRQLIKTTYTKTHYSEGSFDILSDKIYIPTVYSIGKENQYNWNDTNYMNEDDGFYYNWMSKTAIQSNPELLVKISGYILPQKLQAFGFKDSLTQDPSTQSSNNVKEGALWRRTTSNDTKAYVFLPDEVANELNLNEGTYASSVKNYSWYAVNKWTLRTIGYMTAPGGTIWRLFITQNSDTLYGGSNVYICPCFSI